MKNLNERVREINLILDEVPAGLELIDYLRTRLYTLSQIIYEDGVEMYRVLNKLRDEKVISDFEMERLILHKAAMKGLRPAEELITKFQQKLYAAALDLPEGYEGYDVVDCILNRIIATTNEFISRGVGNIYWEYEDPVNDPSEILQPKEDD